MIRTAREINERKLVEKLVPAKGFGQLWGLLATSYELQPDFVELDFLPALLELGAWDDRSWASRIELEKKLASLEGAVIFMQASRYAGRPRSPRLRLVPVVRNAGVLHAKVTLLIFENAVRLIVGSANLTRNGYRENREVAAVITASADSPAAGPLLEAALEPLPGLFRHWWDAECQRLVDQARELLAEWPPGPSRGDSRWFVWSGAGQPLWQRFLALWPPDETVRRVRIVSPFWSDDASPLRRLAEELQRRHLLAQDSENLLHTEAAPAAAHADEDYLPALPAAYRQFAPGKPGPAFFAQAVDPRVPEQEVQIRDYLKTRPLHAKMVLFEGETTGLAYLGSANFTARGWGFVRDPSRANIEAGLVVRATGKQKHELAHLLPPAVGRRIPLDGKAGGTLATQEQTEPVRPWPAFIREILLSPRAEDAESLELTVRIADELLPSHWRIAIADHEGGLGQELYRSGAAQDTNSLSLAIEAGVLEQILREQQLLITWPQCPQGGFFPVNLAYTARQSLPLAVKSGGLQESQLIDYYQGKISWEELFPNPHGQPPGKDNGPDGNDRGKSQVDTSRICSYQVREFIEALRGLKEDLRAASRSIPAAMRLALLGEISPVSLARAVVKGVEATDSGKTPVAAGFQLVELIACLRAARNYRTSSRYQREWREFVDQATGRIEGLLAGLRGDHPEFFRNNSVFRRYEKTARRLPETSTS